MRYIDSGSRDVAHALGTWLAAELTADIDQVRVQSGFFSVNGLAPFLATFDQLAKKDGLVRVVVGSNDGSTLASHLAELVKAVGLPRTQGHLGVVYCSGGYFHTKTYHVHRNDGSQAAYVGSANFTESGIGAGHIEGGILLDTRTGDSAKVLTEIAAATDWWFGPSRPGFEPVTGLKDVGRLLAEGVVRLSRPPAPDKPSGKGGKVPARPSLKPLIKFPGLGGASDASATDQSSPKPTGTPPGAPKPAATSVARVGYPPDFAFAPNATKPTTGSGVLSGKAFPHGTGLIFEVSKDADRLFRGGDGTANFTIPVSTTSTLRFGSGQNPRAELGIETRYLSNNGIYTAAPAPTSVMLYGYGPNPTGNKDRRLVIPKAPINELIPILSKSKLPGPTKGDIAAIEWPEPERPTFRLTFIDPKSAMAKALREAWQGDRAIGFKAGVSSTWLPANLLPAW